MSHICESENGFLCGRWLFKLSERGKGNDYGDKAWERGSILTESVLLSAKQVLYLLHEVWFIPFILFTHKLFTWVLSESVESVGVDLLYFSRCSFRECRPLTDVLIWFSLVKVCAAHTFSQRGVVNTTPKRQPGGPGSASSASSPFPCPAVPERGINPVRHGSQGHWSTPASPPRQGYSSGEVWDLNCLLMTDCSKIHIKCLEVASIMCRECIKNGKRIPCSGYLRGWSWSEVCNSSWIKWFLLFFPHQCWFPHHFFSFTVSNPVWASPPVNQISCHENTLDISTASINFSPFCP